MDWSKIASIDDILKLAADMPRDPRSIQEYGDKLREDFRRRMQLQDKQKDDQVLESQKRQLQDDSFSDDKNEANRILQMDANNNAEEEWRRQREMERLSEQGVYASIKNINDFYSYLVRNV